MALTNYGELKLAVRDWLNRLSDPDVLSRNEDFIRLAEANLFRFYAARNNEVALIVDRTSEDPITDTIPVPNDYREMLTFTCDERPVTRVALTEIQAREGNAGTTVGWPLIFARDIGDFKLWPFPDAGRTYRLTYYAKLAQLASDTDTNALLTNEPGLYLYGALTQAEPFVRGEDAQMVAVWKQEYDALMAGTGLERDEEDRSGSTNVVNAAFGAGASTTSAFSRRGWA